MKRKKIDVITLHRIVNYGSVLQAYATQAILTQKGYEVEFIDYYPERMHILGMLKRIRNKSDLLRKNILARTAARIIMLPSYIQRFGVFKKFLKKYLKMTPKTYQTEEELEEYVPKADIYCTGSDQVWNTGWNEKIDYPFFLKFAPKNKKCIAIAASFGKSELEDWEKEETKELLSKYSALSMRELSGVKIAKDLGFEDAINILDPTLLLNREEWSQLASDKYSNHDYVFVYNLNRNKKIDAYVQKLAKEKKLKIYYVSYCLHEFYKKGKMKCNVKVEDFLALIKNAKYVVTDSFHATAFSINFNTQFMIVFPDKYSTRVKSILEITKLESRIVKDPNDISLSDEIIDFNEANAILREQRKIANDYIDKILK